MNGVMMQYRPVIGLEIHAQLSTKTKIFCNCLSEFGKKPNTNICPVCSGLPGVLPILNKSVLEGALKVSIATNCSINKYSRFARKNYFYPDLPKGYQISQFEEPLSEHGYIDVGLKQIRIKRIHMEEDAGKLIHSLEDGINESYVDFNRAGTPLIEIVTEPDIYSVDEAITFLKKLRELLLYLNVCDCNMEEGSFRADANISIQEENSSLLGVKIELKNMNSFKFTKKALDFEIERQKKILSSGFALIQETRLWNEALQYTESMREKEESSDYRYFPEPDLVPIIIDDKWIQSLKRNMVELPESRRTRFREEYSLPENDIQILLSQKSLADFFEECVFLRREPKEISNWIATELLRELNRDNIEVSQSKITPKHLIDMLKLIDKKIINRNIAKTVFIQMYNTAKNPGEIIKDLKLTELSDEDQIKEVINKILHGNQNQVNEYLAGNEKLLGFFMGLIMKEGMGKINPQIANKLLKELLKEKENDKL